MEEHLTIHFYLKDKSHSMNALVRHQMEKQILDVLSEFQKITGLTFSIETEAYQEGGLKERYIFFIDKIVAPSIVGLSVAVLTNMITDPTSRERSYANLDLIKKQIKTEEIKQSNLEKDEELKGIAIEEAKIDLEIKKEKLQQEQLRTQEVTEQVEQSKSLSKISRSLSNWYQKAQNYEKIEKIGYLTCNSQKETIVDRSSFKDFILANKEDIEVDDEAIIEIVSPVLDEGTNKWRGNYKGEKIVFSMRDKKYKQKVVKGQQTFQNGSRIKCRMEIRRKYDDFGEEVGKPSYRVSHVDEIEIGGRMFQTETGAKRAKKILESKQGSLFGEEYSENGESK